jgi:hypothetical protein
MQTRELDTDTDTDALDAFRLEDVLFCPEAFEAFASGEFDGLRETEDEEQRAA